MKIEKGASYGIMAVIRVAGVSPECDETHFDGWYCNCPDTIEEVFALFKKRYPEADVFIIKKEAAAWRDMERRLPDEMHDKLVAAHNHRCERTGT